ncbi:acyl-CoA dehydrogenase [Streptomyces sp. V2]|uniref:Acyl-CoA dehydrogenase family protein n=1 Tax=Streptomyces niveiscabiei TaxID=164115 RepID=A0ABW9HM05_9ACTN|nr:acyl-CoA dehydrogenase family protein [Streptomyces sp. V2]PWG13063.1 acyl-CoA dehydrogenase [Streptomyces sp. V2]
MRFRLTDDQRALRAGVREVLDRRFGAEALRAAVGKPALDRGLWRALGEAGFFALRLPEEAGGVGLGLPEAVLAFEEAGRALLPGPLVATHLAAGAVPGAAEGETVVAMVDGGLVEWWEEADVVIGEEGAIGKGGAIGEGGSGAVAVRSVDPLTPLHRVSGAVPRAGDPVAALRAGDPVAVLLTAAEQLGTAARAGELAVEHARTREQFGRPIGAFQAVQHLCAEALVRVEVARAAVYAASVTGDAADIAGARVLADEAAVQGARDCLQVLGGMGFTWEADVHLSLKRAWVRARRAGGARESEELLARELLSGAG